MARKAIDAALERFGDFEAELDAEIAAQQARGKHKPADDFRYAVAITHRHWRRFNDALTALQKAQHDIEALVPGSTDR